MAVPTVAESSRALPLGAALPFLVAGALYLVMLLAGDKLLNDPDSYWHLVLGRWIVDHAAFPHSDPFSFTFMGAHWIAKEWLSQVLYAGAHALAGWTGMAILAAAAVALAFALLTRALLDELAPVAALALVAAAFLLVAPHVVARPHALALPVMLAFVAGLLRAADRGRAPALWLLPLMALWANLHGGFTLGILLVGAVGLDAIVAAQPEARRKAAVDWIGFGLLTLVAGSITPYGPESALVTLRILALGPALSIIGEWRPQDFSRIGGFEVVLLLALGLAFWRGFRLSAIRIVILLGLLHLALSAERNGEILGLLAPLVIARPLARQFAGLAPQDAPAVRLRSTALIAGALVAAMVPASLAISAASRFAPNARITPEAAVAAIKAANPGRVFNAYDFGGYLIYAGIAPFIDGRTELYGSDFVMRHQRAVTLADLDDLLRLLDEYRIGATLLQPSAPAVAFLDRSPAWRRLYADDIAVVHVRR
jgi:hypothetical protein